MDRPALERLAEEAAEKHGLPASIVKAICAVESSWDPTAQRFEPDYRWLYRPATYPYHAEGEKQKTSLGLMQLMGACARERGYTGDLDELCNDPTLGIEYGCRHLRYTADRFLARYGWPGVIRAWNTGKPWTTPAGSAYQAKIHKALNGSWP